METRWHSVCGDSKGISVTGTTKISLRLCILNFSGPSALKRQDESVIKRYKTWAQQTEVFITCSRHLGCFDGAGRTGKQLCIHPLYTNILWLET